MIRNILLLAAVSLTAMSVSAQDAAPTDTIPATTAADGTPVEMLDEANIYDDERDEQIDSLRQAVTMLQSQLASQQETIDKVEEDELNRKIWNDRAKYFNIYYVNQSITQEDIDGTWKNDFGVALAMGKTFYLHKKPILGMIKFGIDWSYFDLNFAKYTDNWGFFNGDAEYYGGGGNYYYDYGYGYTDDSYYGIEPEDIYQAEIGTAIGVSVTVNPYDHIKAAGYFRVVPSYSMLYAAEDFSGSYGTFFLAGGSVAYKAISLGIEARWGKAKYDSMLNLDDLDDIDESMSDDDIFEGNYDGSSKWKTGSVRFYISFRF